MVTIIIYSELNDIFTIKFRIAKIANNIGEYLLNLLIIIEYII